LRELKIACKVNKHEKRGASEMGAFGLTKIAIQEVSSQKV